MKVEPCAKVSMAIRPPQPQTQKWSSCTEPTDQLSVETILPGKIFRSSKDFQICRIYAFPNFYEVLLSFSVQNLYVASYLDIPSFKLPALSSD